MSNNKDFKVKNGIQPTVYHEGLGTVTSGSVTVGYDLANIGTQTSQSNVTLLTGEQSFDTGNSGTSLFLVTNNASGDRVYSYTMSTAYDLSTLSATGTFLSVASQENAPNGITLKSDGTSFYIVGSGSDTVFQYDMTTAYALYTASYASKSFSVASQDQVPRDLKFSSDGTKMYVAGALSQTIYQYDLSTAWDVSTASYSSKSFAVGFDPTVHDISSDGTKMIITNIGTYVVYEYTLSTAWDISTAATSGNTYTYSAQRTIVKYSDNGNYLFSYGNPTNDFYANPISSSLTTNTLDLSTGSVFEITPTSNIQIGLSNPAASGTVSQATLLLDGAAGTTYDFSVLATTNKTLTVSGQDVTEEGLYINPDGTELYMLGDAADSVFQYTMTTAWDLSTASYTQSFSGASQDGGMQGVSFKTDGTKMYMLGRSNDNLYQYSLSTAWDISTASYDSVSLNVTSQDTNPYNLHFKPDGTKLYIVGNTNNRIYQYSLSTAWDLSTASYDSVSYTTTSQDGTPKDIYIKSDGTKLYLLGRDNHKIFVYTMSTAWDLSTISYDSISYPSSGNLETYDTSSNAFYISDDGVYFYLVGGSTGDIEQFYIAGAATITYDSTLQFGGGTAPESPAIGETDVLTFSTRDGGTTYQAAIAIDGAA